MKRLASGIVAVLFALNFAISQCKDPCIDTIQPGLKMLGKTIVNGSDCLFTVEFCIRKTSSDAHHVDFAVYHTHGNLQETVDISRLPVDSVYCKIFSFIANCNSTASFIAVGKTVNNSICGTVSDLIILPIRLLSFTAELQKNRMVQLKWQTASEANSSHFVIQHSDDGKSFSDLGIVKAAGESTLLKSYQFEASSQNTSSSNQARYFRLKMMDKDDSYSFSPIIHVKITGAKNIIAYPNPASHSLTLDRGDIIKENISLWNTYSCELPLFWMNENTIDISNLGPGIYFLSAADEVLRFIKN